METKNARVEITDYFVTTWLLYLIYNHIFIHPVCKETFIKIGKDEIETND